MESVFFALALLACVEALVFYGLTSRTLAWPCCGVLWFGVLCFRYRRHWNMNLLIRRLDPRDAAVYPVVGDLITQRYHKDSSPSLVRHALDQLDEILPPRHSGWKSLFLRRPVEYLVGIALLSLPVALSWLESDRPSLDIFQVILTPPDYLAMPAYEVSFSENYLEVYPGTLFSCRLQSESKTYLLVDKRGSLYLPTQLSPGQWKYDIRILRSETLVLSRDGKVLKRWGLNCLEDLVPDISWRDNPVASVDWRELQLGYRAHDDLGLGQAFITVGGVELEYAGQPEGQREYQYSWSFDPLEYIDLQGGDLELTVVVYDQDNILGPKKSSTAALVWHFEGVVEKTRKALSALARVTERVDQRLDELKEDVGSPENSTADMMSRLQSELESHPVVSNDLTDLVSQMESEYRQLLQQAQDKGVSSQSRRDESRQLQRDQMYLDFVRTRLEQILSTVETSELISRLQKMSADMRAGEAASSSEMEQLYKDLKEHLERSGIHEGLKSQILKSIEQAQLSNTLGDTDMASASLQEAADMMREASNQGQGGSSELSKNFEEKLETLDHLIEEQNINRVLLQEELLKDPDAAEVAQLQKNIDSLVSDLASNPLQKAFADLQLRYLKSTEDHQFGPDSGELIQQLTQSDALKGRDLQSLQKNLEQLRDELSKPAVRRTLQSKNPDLLDFEKFSQSLASAEQVESYRQLLEQMERLGRPPAFSEDLRKRQQRVAQTGSQFAEEFRSEFQMLLPQPAIFDLADQGSWHAGEATVQLRAGSQQSFVQMYGAHNKWLTAKQLLNHMMSQARSRMSGGSKLRIGRDGQLQLQKRPDDSGREGDQEQPDKDIEISLPEDFRKPEDIERRLNEELKSIQDPNRREIFRDYMLDLLQ